MSTETKEFKLTPSQDAAIKDLSTWWQMNKNSDAPAFVRNNIVLKGGPGTGKTFLAKYFAEQLPECVPLFTAPTNEAVRQLEISLQGKSPTKTTYSALGLKLSMRSFKQKIYQSKLPSDFDNYNLLVVDESSMAGLRDKTEKGAADDLMDYVLGCGMRVIWLGDWAQLPPVSSTTGESPVFEQKFPEIELLEVKRHSGDILQFASMIREELKKPVRNLPKEIPAGVSIKNRDSAGMMAFTADEFQAIIEDRARILTWTNGVTKYSKVPGVNEYNTRIRHALFGAELAEESDIWPSDRILMASPLMGTDDQEKLSMENLMSAEWKMLASVNTRAEVLSVEPCTILGVECHKTLVELEGGTDSTIYIPTKVGQLVKSAQEKVLMDLAIKAGDAQLAGKAWTVYHTYRQAFADVKHTYCVTTHRSQGSTIPHVFVDVGNILQNRDRLVAFKSLYVASTRAAESLTLCLR
jgi:hypothetical protein